MKQLIQAKKEFTEKYCLITKGMGLKKVSKWINCKSNLKVVSLLLGE